MLKRVLLLSGSPGVGKTTVLAKTVDALAKRGFKAGGMISREVRLNGERIGFEILGLGNSRRGWLAQVNQGSGPRVGRYCVNLKDLEEVGAVSIMEAVGACDIVTIDEIGPMELFSRKFREAVTASLQSSKLVLGVVHWRMSDRLIIDIKDRKDCKIFVVTHENREELVELMISRAEEYLERR